MAIGKLERSLRARVAREALNWRTMPYGERDGFGYESLRERPLPSQLLLGLLFTRLLDQQPELARTFGTVPCVVSIRVTSEQAGEVLAKVGPYVAESRFPRREKARGQPDGRRRVCALREQGRDLGMMRKEEARERLASGASLLFFWHEHEDSLLPELRLVVTSSLSLPPVDVHVLSWLGRIVTGEPCRFSRQARYDDLIPGQLDVAFSYGLTAPECQRRLAAMQSLLDTKVVEETGPQPTRLEELPAFGAAGAWGVQLIADLAAYKAGALQWSELDKGALLHGPPGVGKNCFVTALAASCGVPFYPTSVAEWYSNESLGPTLRHIRAVFSKAASTAPCIVFIDELDGIGDRGDQDRHRQYWTQIINCLLEVLDGITRRDGVIVIGACNHPHRVDPAILRPGRLDRMIQMRLPDEETIAVIYRHYLEGDLREVNIGSLASITRGRTGAEIEQIVRLARRGARHQGRGIELEDLIREVRGSMQFVSEMTLRRTAVHEAGHAVAAILLNVSANVSVTLNASGSLGATRLERDPHVIDTRETALNFVRQTLAGRAAEEIILGSISGGSGGGPGTDLAQATRALCAMEGSLGLGRTLTYWADVDATPRHLARPSVPSAIERDLRRLYRQSKKLIEHNRDGVVRVADALQERLYLGHAEISRLMGDPGLPPASRTSTPSSITRKNGTGRTNS